MSSLYRKIREKAAALEGDTVRFLSDMIRTPSFSTKEAAVIDVIKKEMERVGFDDQRVDRLGNVIGRVGSGPRTVAFDAHIDTVYAGDESLWNTPPFEPVVKEGVITGRGAVDQKGGMAAMVTAARIIRELGLNEDFTFLFTGTVMEEDCDGLCWQYIIDEEKIRPELVVITEPTNLNIHRGQRGRMEMCVTAGGISCHGSAPERGENAVYKAARIALEIEKLNGRLADDPFLGKGTVTVTQFASSSPSLCAVPDGASLHLDRRLTAEDTKERAIAEVCEAADLAGFPDAVVTVPEYRERSFTGLSYPMEKYYPTWVLAGDSPWLDGARKTFTGLFGKEPVVDKWVFSTNGVAVAGLNGIPCIGFGPGHEKHAHAPNETCPVRHLTDAAAFYAAFAANLNRRG